MGVGFSPTAFKTTHRIRRSQLLSLTCLVCQRSFKFEHGNYNGRYVQTWDAYVCQPCVTGNHDGIVVDAAFIERLAAKGITPEKNARGWIAIP